MADWSFIWWYLHIFRANTPWQSQQHDTNHRIRLHSHGHMHILCIEYRCSCWYCYQRSCVKSHLKYSHIDAYNSSNGLRQAIHNTIFFLSTTSLWKKIAWFPSTQTLLCWSRQITYFQKDQRKIMTKIRPAADKHTTHWIWVSLKSPMHWQQIHFFSSGPSSTISPIGRLCKYAC